MIKHNSQEDRKFREDVSNSIKDGLTKRIFSLGDIYINFGIH